MFLHVASNYAKLSKCLICFLKKANLILLLVIPVLLSGFSNLLVSWTLVPKPPGSRHSQGFSSSKWGSGLLNGFCTVYRALSSQERRVCLSLYLHLGTAHCSQQWLWLGVGTKHLQGSDFWGCPASATLNPPKGNRWCVCRPAFLCAHPGTPTGIPHRGFLGLGEAGSPKHSVCLWAPRWVCERLSFQGITCFCCLPIAASSTYEKI